MSLRLMIFGPRRTALHVKTTLGLQSRILCASDSEENPANTTWKIGNYGIITY